MHHAARYLLSIYGTLCSDCVNGQLGQRLAERCVCCGEDVQAVWAFLSICFLSTAQGNGSRSLRSSPIARVLGGRAGGGAPGSYIKVILY